jgi:transcriptional regulator
MLTSTHEYFRVPDDKEAVRFIRATCLGTLVTFSAAEGFRSSQIPFQTKVAANGKLRLITHMPFANSQWRCVEQGANCLVIFLGPNGYISPSWFPSGGRDRAPTWNFQVVHVTGTLVPLSESETWDHLRELSRDLEASIGGDWCAEEMGERFNQLAQNIAALEIMVEHLEHKAKLGQDESDANFLSAVSALDHRASSRVLAALMRSRSSRMGQLPHGTCRPTSNRLAPPSD